MRTCGGMADTVDLGSTAKAWGFESLQVHQSRVWQTFRALPFHGVRRNML